MAILRLSQLPPAAPRGPFLSLLLSIALVITGTAVLSGCATSESSGSKNFDRKTISRNQIASYNSSANAYQIVQTLRPNWLAVRPSSLTTESSNEVRVYVDGVRFGAAPTALRQILVRNIESLRYFDRREAATRFGTGHTQGVIMIYTRRG
jgi:hypothetical protein